MVLRSLGWRLEPCVVAGGAESIDAFSEGIGGAIRWRNQGPFGGGGGELGDAPAEHRSAYTHGGEKKLSSDPAPRGR